MARPKAKTPALRFHISGQSVCTIDGRDFYLGKHNSPKSLARYAVLIARYQSGGLSLPSDFSVESLDENAKFLLQSSPVLEPERQADEPILVCHVTAAYRIYAEKTFGSDSKELSRIKKVCKDLENNDGNILADEYGSKALMRQRDRWVETGRCCRAYVNRLVDTLKKVFVYGILEELVDESVAVKQNLVPCLREGKTKAHDNDKVKPVPLDAVRATAKHLPPIVRDMVRVQLATGMRPSELFRLRPCDLDRSGDVWMYRPPEHKNRKKGKDRSIPILGDAKEALIDYLNRASDSFCFSPAETSAWARSQQRAQRVGSGSRKPIKVSPASKPNTQYTANGYRQVIARACDKAGVPHWTPYQLRHRNLTDIRHALTAEHAQAMAGHSSLKQTETYASVSEAKAIEAAKSAPTL